MLSLHHSIGCFFYDVRKVLEHLAKYFITLRAECWACLRTVRSPCAINRACLSQICFGRISTSVYLEGEPFIFCTTFLNQYICTSVVFGLICSGRPGQNVQKHISKWIPINFVQYWKQASPNLGQEGKCFTLGYVQHPANLGNNFWITANKPSSRLVSWE